MNEEDDYVSINDVLNHEIESRKSSSFQRQLYPLIVIELLANSETESELFVEIFLWRFFSER